MDYPNNENRWLWILQTAEISTSQYLSPSSSVLHQIGRHLVVGMESYTEFQWGLRSRGDGSRSEIPFPSAWEGLISDCASIRAPTSVLAEMWSKLVIWAPPAPGLLFCCNLHIGHKHGILVGKFTNRKERTQRPYFYLGTYSGFLNTAVSRHSGEPMGKHPTFTAVISATCHSAGKKGNKINPLERKG